MHVKLHVSVKLKCNVINLSSKSKFSFSGKTHLILLGKGLLAALLGALEVGAVLPGQVPAEGGEGEHDGDVAHVTLVFGRLLFLLLGIARFHCFFSAGGFCLFSPDLLGLCSLCVGLFFPVGLLVMRFKVMSEIFLVLEHFVAILALEQIIVLVPLFMAFSV